MVSVTYVCNMNFNLIPFWCSEQKNGIESLLFFHGRRKKRLKYILTVLIPEADCIYKAYGLPPVKSEGNSYRFEISLVICGNIGECSGMPLLSFWA
jgi:hypothetical protein